MEQLWEDEILEFGMGLNVLLSKQMRLQVESFKIAPDDLTDEDRAQFLTWNAYALIDEITEAMAEVGWKPWATSRHINKEAFTKELVDALHFFANLCLAAGVSGMDLAQAYAAKNAVNAQRQEQGYDGLNKCEDCGRAFDDGLDKYRGFDGRIYCETCYYKEDDGGIGFSNHDHGDR